MEFLDIAFLGAAAAAGALSSRKASFSDVSWQGRGNFQSWCRLFRGDRFHLAGGMHSESARNNALAPVKRKENYLVIPSTTIKDIISMNETTRLIRSGNGTVTERVCELTARKLTCSEVTFNVFAGYKGMYSKDDKRFFLHKTTGPYLAQPALQMAINKDTDNPKIEILMEQDDLFKLIAFIRSINYQGGYAVCEISQVDQHWCAVQNIVILGKPSNAGKVEHSTASISHRLRQGKRYVREYHSATKPGAGMTCDMIAKFPHAGPVDKHSYVSRTPVAWREKNTSSLGEWDLEVKKITYVVDEDAPIEKDIQEVYTPITRPLHGVSLAVESRDSKTSCSALVEASSSINTTTQPSGYASSLSILGAVITEPNGQLWQDSGDNTRVRVDSINKSILQKCSLKKHDCFAAQYVSTGIVHKAGFRGNFVVYRVVPVVNLNGTWYDCKTLKTVRFNSAPSKDIRYISLSRAGEGKSVEEDFTLSFSDSIGIDT